MALREDDRDSIWEVRRQLTSQSSQLSFMASHVMKYDHEGDYDKIKQAEALVDQARQILFDMV